MKAPTTVKEVRRFMGMYGFYRKHVPSFAKIAAPLTNLIRARTIFTWTEESQQAFEQLKACLMDAPVLVKAQVDQSFNLTTDASNSHVGGVLSQIQPDGSNAPTSLLVTSQRNLIHVRLAILPRITKCLLWYWPSVTFIITYGVHDSQ